MCCNITRKANKDKIIIYIVQYSQITKSYNQCGDENENEAKE